MQSTYMCGGTVPLGRVHPTTGFLILSQAYPSSQSENFNSIYYSFIMITIWGAGRNWWKPANVICGSPLIQPLGGSIYLSTWFSCLMFQVISIAPNIAPYIVRLGPSRIIWKTYNYIELYRSSNKSPLSKTLGASFNYKHFKKRKVWSLVLNVERVSISWTGSWFHKRGAW